MVPPTDTPTRRPGKPEPADLRLIVPAVSAWAVTFTVLVLGPGHRDLLLLVAALAAASALVLLVSTGRPQVSTVLAAALLTAAAATVTTVLHTADLHRGPLPVLAHPPPRASATEPDGVPGPAPDAGPDAGPDPLAELTVDVTIDGDPKSHVSRTRGTAPGQSLLTVRATVDRVTLPEPPTAIRTRTPVTVMVRAQDAPAWQGLIPSTRLTADVRVLPADEGSGSSAAVLLAHGPPRLLARPGLPQRMAGRLRAGLRAACDHLPADTRGLLPGLVVGDTSRLPDDLQEAFRATDLGHLTAVSGANLAIILTVLIGTPGRAGAPGRGGLAGLLGLPLRATAVLGTALTLAFVTVCRPDPSVLRAAATGLIGLLALATGRPRQALPALSAAALLLILLDPYLARSYGFVLSVLATTGLLTLGPRWSAALLRRGWPHHLATAVAATAAAQALCAPVTILLAPRISLVAVPCNLLAELAVAPATLLGFAALSVDPFSRAVACFLADLAALPAGWLAAVARRGAALPGAQLAWPGGLFGAFALAVGTLALGWAARPFLTSSRRSDRSHVRAAAAATLGLILLVVLLRPPLLTRIATGWPPPGWKFVMCDIGQGDMTVLPLSSDPGGVPDSAVVVDTGPDPRAADTCLRDLGITRIPLLIISHFHADHAEGLPGVLHGRSIGALQVTTLDAPPGEHARVLGWAAGARVPVLRAQRGEHRSASPQLSWDVLWPDGRPGPATPGANNASIALLATVGPPDNPLRIALLGDLEPPAQTALRTGLRPPRVDILKVAHHGSANQDWDLIDALHPRLALISCGVDNPYGHPSARTVSRLGALGSTVLRTDRSGDIAVLGTPTGLRAATHPHEHRYSQGLRAPRPRPPPNRTAHGPRPGPTPGG